MTRTFPKLIALMFALGVMAGCSSTGETQEEGAYGSDVSAVDQEGGSKYTVATDPAACRLQT